MSLAWWLNEQKTLGPYVHPRFLSSTQTRETLRLEDPFTGKVLTSSVECATTEDVDAAVHAAEAALHATPEGAWQFPDARRQALIALADLIDKHRDAFIHIEGLTAGKPHWGAEYDVQTTIDVFRHFAGYADKIAGKVYQAHPGCFTSHTEKYPVGVVALIVSFNYPLMLTAWKLAPALAAGNAVLIKPSDSTPLSLLYLASLLQKEPSLFPPGVVSILPGDHVAGSHLASHPKIQKLSFTGSTPVGRKILSAAATSNLKRVTLELGGKSPIIVAGDWTDMDKLVNDIFSAAFFNQGQNCCGGTRLYLHKRLYQPFLEKFAKKCNDVQWKGTPWPATLDAKAVDKSYLWGPLQNRAHFARIIEGIEKAKKEGSKVLCGAEYSNADKEGFFIRPTAFYDVEDNDYICREEVFGPVLSICQPYYLHQWDDIDECIRRAEATEFGLAGAVYTKDYDLARKIIRAIRSGTVWWNCYNIVKVHVPFGGLKGGSGYGKDLGEEALDEYSITKTVLFCVSPILIQVKLNHEKVTMYEAF